MKRFLTALVLLLTLSLVGCDLGGNELETALDNMGESDNVTIVMTMSNVPLFGSISATVKSDGTTQSVEMLGEIEYFEVVDGELYAYLGDGTLSETPEEDGSPEDMADFDLFSAEDFEEEDGVWVLQLEKIYVDDSEEGYVSNVEITVESGNITLLEFDVTEGEITMGISMEFSDYGTTEVELPTA